MKLWRILTCLSLSAGLILSAGCGGSGLGEFQVNEDAEYKLFNILDPYPSLHEAVDRLDQTTVNDIVSRSVDTNLDNFLVTTEDSTRVIKNTDRPLQSVLNNLQTLLGRIIHQDDLDSNTGSTYYAQDLFSLIDDIRKKDLNVTDDLISIIRTANLFQLEEYSSARMRDLSLNEIDSLSTYDFSESINNAMETLGKLFMQADYSMWLASDTSLVTKRGDIASSGVTDIGLGNAVQGINAFLMSLSTLARDDEISTDLFNILREVGNLAATSITTPSGSLYPADIIKRLIENTEDYFTVGGSHYSDTENGIELFGRNPSDTTYYANSELGRLILSMLPGNVGLLARSDRPESLISQVNPLKAIGSADYSGDKYKNYVLDLLVQNLRRIEFDPDTARIEESLYDLIRYDTYGRDRRSSDAYPVSYLEQFIFLSVMSQDAGWADGGDNGEITSTSDPSKEHGHGASVEYVSFNDSLFAMGGSETLGMNTYSLAFNDNQNAVSRSHKTRFWRSNRGDFKFGYSTNWAAQKFMSGACQGDVGVPIGGNPTGGAFIGTDNYMPYTANGFGDPNMSRYTLYWMVRACWNGEGPYYYDPSLAGKNVPTVTFQYDDGTGLKDHTWYVFYRPNGKIYAFKETTTGAFVYPADGDDPVAESASDLWDGGRDLSHYNGKYERWNRYRDTWYSDYYMINVVNDGVNNWYLTPDGGTGIRTYKVDPEWYIGEPDNFQADRFRFKEIIAQNYDGRACASPEEAIFRNYQWVMTEKTFAIVVPLSLKALDGFSNAGAFQIVQGNGIAGLTSARKYRSDANVWAVANNTAETSPHPGDYRIVMHVFGDTILGFDTIWHSICSGTVNPPCVTHNAPGVYRFGFPRYYKGSYNDSGVDTLGSRKLTSDDLSNNQGFKAGDSKWNRRNTLLPLIITLLGTLLDNQNRDFSVAANRALTLERMKKFSEAMMIPILPRFYYKYSGSSTSNTWVPRIAGNTADASVPHHRRIHKRSYQSSVGNLTVNTDPSYWGGWTQRNYYQPIAVRTPLNLLYDSDINDPNKRCDGLLALLTEYDSSQLRGLTEPKTRLVTRILKLLMKLGDSRFDDPTGLDYSRSDFDTTYETWGPRRKLLYGLEQIMTAQKGTKSKVVELLARSPKNINFASWMFALGSGNSHGAHYDYYDSYSGVRGEDVIVNKALHALIGHNPISPAHSGLGFAVYPDERDPSDPNYASRSWDTFYDGFLKASELLSNNGTKYHGKYNIMETLIEVTKKFIAKVEPSNDQIKALVHTLGAVATQYDSSGGEWQYPGDIKVIMTEHLPKILEEMMNNPTLGSTGSNLYMSKEFNATLLTEQSLIPYLAATLGTSYSSRQIMYDIHGLLSDPLIHNKNSKLWTDLAIMNENMIDCILRSKNSDDLLMFQDSGFQYNEDMERTPFDYFGSYGKVLSK